MSRENVDLVRTAYEVWNRGDIDAAFELLDPAVEVSVPANFLEAGTYRGHAETRILLQEFMQAWEHVGVEPQEFIDAGDQVVVFIRYFGRGKESGLDVRGANVDAHVWTLTGEKVVKLEMYPGTRDALRAVGLENAP